jgi:hypothetical protein
MEQTSNLQDFYLIQPTDYIAIFEEFNKPITENRFLINYDYLLDDCNNIDFSKDVWIMKPEYFCADHYNHPFVYPVILLANNLKSIFEFKPNKFIDNKIAAPKINKIIKVLSSYI